MSGICSIIHFDGESVTQPALEKMTAAVAYRGPDGIHHWVKDTVGVSSLALHITPECAYDKQPLSCPKRQLVLTADARIDNRTDLVHVLLTKGYLQTQKVSDAQIILAAYQYWGTACAEYLIGDFAFAIWDQDNYQLYAARDPMGMRSLVYRREANRFLFATEVKQILAAPNVPTELFAPAVGAYLCGPRGSSEWTFYQGISQLPPGHSLLVTPDHQRLWRYWDIDPAEETVYRNDQQYFEHFREIFQDAVRCRLRSSHPVGLLLSGGTDSGCIASMVGYLKKQYPNQSWPSFYTLSHAFEKLTECDERHISQHIVNFYHLNALDIPADSAWPMSGYPQRGPDRNSPFIGVYSDLFQRSIDIAKEQGAKVLISGNRGDEMVGDEVFDFPGLFRTGQWFKLWQDLLAYSQLTNQSLRSTTKYQLIKPLLFGQSMEDFRKHRGFTTYPDWIQDAFAKQVNLSEILKQTDQHNPFKAYAKGRRYWRIFMLAGTQIAMYRERELAKSGMSFADPWSDSRLAKFILSIPPHLVDRPAERKSIARKAMSGIIPNVVIKKTRKTIPDSHFDIGFQDKSKEKILDLIQNSRISALGYIDEATLLSRYQDYLSGKPPKHDFWWPITLEMWLRRFFD